MLIPACIATRSTHGTAAAPARASKPAQVASKSVPKKPAKVVTASKLVEQFYLPVMAQLPPRYNVAPSQMVAAIVRPAGQLSRQLAWLKR